MKRLHTLYRLLALLPACLLTAQEKAPVPTVNLSFKTYLWENIRVYTSGSRQADRQKEPQLWYYSPEGWKQVRSSRGQLSKQSFHYQGPLPIRFYDRDPSGMEELPKPVAEVDVPESWSKVMMLLLPSGDQVRLMPVEYSANSLKNGQGRIYNLSNDELAWVIGQSKGKLKPKAHANASLLAGDGGRYLKTALLTREDEAWEVRYQSKMPAGARKRLVVIAFKPDPQRNDYAIKTISLPEEK